MEKQKNNKKRKSIPAIEYLHPIKKEERCIRPCPYDQRLGEWSEWGGDIIMLGSHSCLCCEFCKNKNHKYNKKGDIVCSYLQDTYLRKMATEGVAFDAAKRSEKFQKEYAEYKKEKGEISEEDFFREVYRPRRKFKRTCNSKKFKSEYKKYCFYNGEISEEDFYNNVFNQEGESDE